MEKLNYKDFVEEATLLAIRHKKRPITYTLSFLVFMITAYALVLQIIRMRSAGLDYVGTEIFSCFALLLSILSIFLARLIPIHVEVSRMQISKAIVWLLAKTENECLEDMNECSDYLDNLRESIESMEEELRIARENYIQFSSDYLIDVEDCIKQLRILNNALPEAKEDFETASNNLRDLSSLKKALKQWWL